MSIHIKKSKTAWTLIIGLIMTQTACKKFVQIDPPTVSVTSSTVYNNNTAAAAIMTSVYANMANGLSSGPASISLSMGLAADELKNYNPNNQYNLQFYTNALRSASGQSSNYYFWTELYREIYVCNNALEGLENSTGVSFATKQQIIGEAKFMRAFLSFYATNLYGDIPLVTTTDFQVNNTIRRSSSTLVYQQIIADLKDAQSKLGDNFVDASGNISIERVRPNKAAATALLARVYLYHGDTALADSAATAVINNTNYVLSSDLNQVFLANSTESIWQLQSIISGYNTFDAPAFVITSTPGTNGFSIALSPGFQNKFEVGDARLTNWVGRFTDPLTGTDYYYPFKYKVYLQDQPVTEYTMVLRLAEQYLIRAEAEANGAGAGMQGAIADLNTIRNRAGLPNYTGATDKTSILTTILHERQVELFSEWGHRWFDLKRTNNLNSTMGSPGNVCLAKGGTWSQDWGLLPIPLSEMQINHNLTQNPGY